MKNGTICVTSSVEHKDQTKWRTAKTDLKTARVLITFWMKVATALELITMKAEIPTLRLKEGQFHVGMSPLECDKMGEQSNSEEPDSDCGESAYYIQSGLNCHNAGLHIA